MAVLAKLQRYTRQQYLIFLLGSLFLLTVIGWIQLLPVLFLISIPVLVFFRWTLRQQQHHGVTDREIEQLFLTFLGGALLIPGLAFVIKLALVPLLVSLFSFGQSTSIQTQLHNYFDSSNDDRVFSAHGSKPGAPPTNQQFDSTVGHIALVFAAFFLVAVTEEFLKYWVVQGTCGCRASQRKNCMHSVYCCWKPKQVSVPAFSVLKQRQQRHGALPKMMCHPSRLLFYHRPHANHAFVVFLAVIAAALGLSVMENVVTTLYASPFRDQIKNAILRNIKHVPFQCICGGIIGVRMAERLLTHQYGGSEETGTNAAKVDLGRWRTKLAIIFPAVLIHTTFAMQQFFVTTFVTDNMKAARRTVYHVVFSTAGNAIIVIPAFFYLRHKLHAMENKMNETRYMHVAVDWESGQRREDINFVSNDDYDDYCDLETGSLVEEETRKVWSAFVK